MIIDCLNKPAKMDSETKTQIEQILRIPLELDNLYTIIEVLLKGNCKLTENLAKKQLIESFPTLQQNELFIIYYSMCYAYGCNELVKQGHVDPRI